MCIRDSGYAWGEATGYIVFSCEDTTSGCSGTNGNFIFTNPSSNDCSILFDDVYMHSNYRKSYVYNLSGNYKDNYYVAGSIVSASIPPTGVSMPWTRIGPITLENWVQPTGIPY